MGLALARIDALLTPRRGLALVFACAVLMAVPVAASASCGCLAWSRGYTTYADARTKLDNTLSWYGIGYTARQRIKKGIYDYASDGYVSKSFCDSYPKVCRAVKMCVAAAGPSYVSAKLGGATNKAATMGAVGACASAIASVYLIA